MEERLASVVNATYKQGAAATHVGTERGEVAQLIQYVNTPTRKVEMGIHPEVRGFYELE